MALMIADEFLEAAHLSAAEMYQEIAVLLFQQERLTLAQAARLAQLPHWQFQAVLASRRIPIHYGVAELEADLETLGS
ncbi:MAG: UPF0175 family protein [Chloroflexi bacterium]|nr:UPF0175 family protein [Chloroflexota bacterium]